MTTPDTAPPNGREANFQAAVLQPLFDFWSKSVEQGMEQTKAMLDCMTGACDLATLRRRWLDSLARSLDVYMRSPAFLEAMRRHFDAVTQLHNVTEDWARDAARVAGIPRVPDVSGLFERLRVGQEAILSRLGVIEQRLEALETKRRRHDG
jgi:hypothetical protein